MSNLIDEDDFINVWGAGEELLSHADVKDADRRYVWTVVEDPEGNLIAMAGFHVVNKIDYVLTLKPWENGKEQAMWCPNDMDDDEDWDE